MQIYWIDINLSIKIAQPPVNDVFDKVDPARAGQSASAVSHVIR